MSIETSNKIENIPNDVRFASLKTEKLVTALYMVTNMLPQEEPLKWRIRETGIRLLNDISCADVNVLESHARSVNVLKRISGGIIPLMSFLQIARFSGSLSEMNIALLQKEFEGLLKFIDDVKISEDTVFANKIESELIVAMEVSGSDNSHKNRNENQNVITGSQLKDHVISPEYKGLSVTNSVKNGYTQKSEPIVIKAEDGIKKDETSVQSKSTSIHVEMGRKESILGFIKTGIEYTIKDVAKEIQGVSGKTIQRDLQALVSAGLLHRKGERRWSRYFRP
ncbi:MAG: DeoR family transcriptional regulator [Candidatus Vogelbacteria bacterium]|nr:DeoR family transcriptional regulator [Candidatus Vogelbacteria bacterium]